MEIHRSIMKFSTKLSLCVHCKRWNLDSEFLFIALTTNKSLGRQLITCDVLLRRLGIASPAIRLSFLSICVFQSLLTVMSSMKLRFFNFPGCLQSLRFKIVTNTVIFYAVRLSFHVFVPRRLYHVPESTYMLSITPVKYESHYFQHETVHANVLAIFIDSHLIHGSISH